MATVPAPVATVAAPKVSAFKNIMQHVLKYVTLGLVDIVKYAPAVANLAELLFPPEAGAIAGASAITVQVATLIQNTVLLVQQKYASAPAGDETNAAKLADALAIVEGPAITLLGQAGIKADSARITDAVNAAVAILKLQPAPATA